MACVLSSSKKQIFQGSYLNQFEKKMVILKSCSGFLQTVYAFIYTEISFHVLEIKVFYFVSLEAQTYD